MTDSVSEKIQRIKQEIPKTVKLIAITKQVGIKPMREAYAAGVRDFGENRLQEALTKQDQLQDLTDISWHFIGHIQTNKAKKIIENFDWIHSVDRLSLARRLDKLAQDCHLRPQALLQVKILPDPNKYGWEVPELLSALEELNQYQYLKIRGLMTILPLGLSSEETLKAFQETRKLATIIRQKNYSNLSMEQLSMGMSADYLLAIKAEANVIRLGRIIFGPRNI
ncbi:YggS family pyridoxal phosphate-dependent enzyme [Pleurocapsa sp. PCC 7319]|uniref:YggS family pyridoxal phosphate-dependent enzyme n=1 Tax=Pleurocapsa sp. PCC 7319 TaxID=118161 RepID=UPI000347FB19|nr:YggS family pyridoxal phosphate-dependent enzyme [Pleurocapsa sp. PCC 7319]